MESFPPMSSTIVELFRVLIERFPKENCNLTIKLFFQHQLWYIETQQEFLIWKILTNAMNPHEWIWLHLPIYVFVVLQKPWPSIEEMFFGGKLWLVDGSGPSEVINHFLNFSVTNKQSNSDTKMQGILLLFEIWAVGAIVYDKNVQFQEWGPTIYNLQVINKHSKTLMKHTRFPWIS